MDLTGWIMMFVMLTLCNWTYYSKLPLKLFYNSMLFTGTITALLGVAQVVLLFLGKVPL